jgi:hypothetical protein
MSRSSTLKPIAGALVAAAAVAVLAIILLSGSSGAGDEPGPEIVGVENACKSVAEPWEESAKLIYGTAADGQPEMTEWHTDGSYHVTRCTEEGKLLVRQHVIPVQTPDGLKLLAAETSTPEESISTLLPANFSDTPEGIAVWKETGDRALAHTLPPTAEPTTTESE